MRKPVTALAVTLLFAGCGAEVVGTAATVGRLQASQNGQAQAHKRQIESGVGAALEAGKARADAAAGQ